jgi:hypothetical protein
MRDAAVVVVGVAHDLWDGAVAMIEIARQTGVSGEVREGGPVFIVADGIVEAAA